MEGASCPVDAEPCCALDSQNAPAPRDIPRTDLLNSPKAETRYQQAMPTPDAEAGLQQHPLCFNPCYPFPNQGSTYFTPKQSRHELIYIQCQCTGGYYLTQNQKKSSDKLKRKNLDRLNKLQASKYTLIIISFLNSYFIYLPQKELPAASHQPYSAFPLLEACFYFGSVEGRFKEILEGMTECRELPGMLINVSCPGREAR